MASLAATSHAPSSPVCESSRLPCRRNACGAGARRGRPSLRPAELHGYAVERPSALYLFQDRLEEFTRTGDEPSPAQVHFLAHEDVALKAYAETRARYLGGVAERAAFNQIGEALPAVLIGGRVVGTWSWDIGRRAVRYVAHRSAANPPDQAAIRVAATQVTAALRRGYDDSRVNRAGAVDSRG